MTNEKLSELYANAPIHEWSDWRGSYAHVYSLPSLTPAERDQIVNALREAKSK